MWVIQEISKFDKSTEPIVWRLYLKQWSYEISEQKYSIWHII